MRIVIIGNGVAGVTAARRIRELDEGAELSIIAAEPYHFYFRPRLPELIAGEIELDDALAFPPDWYESRDIDVRLSTRVASIDPRSRSVSLESGETVDYDRLIIASGAHPFVPPIPGAGLDGVLAVRTADDAMALRDRARERKRAVVIGGGLLGIETARGLRHHGLDVTVLEFADWLLPRQLDETGASFLREEVEKLGIGILTAARTSSIDGEGTVESVSLEDGSTLPAEIVVVSTGIRSTLDFLEGSGIATDRGIVVDDGMRTSVEDIFAIGDAAEHDGVIWGIVPVALAQAAVAARFALGDESEPYVPVPPSNTLKITQIDVFSAGETACTGGNCTEYVHADEDAGVYRKVVLRDGIITGAIVIGSRTGVRELGSMIERRQDVGEHGEELVRETFDFKAALR